MARYWMLANCVVAVCVWRSGLVWGLCFKLAFPGHTHLLFHKMYAPNSSKNDEYVFIFSPIWVWTWLMIYEMYA